MKNIKLQHIKFIKENRGAITVATALIFPTLIGFYSIAIDGARFNSERSRLNDALNQSVYALAVQNIANPTDSSVQQANRKIVADYLSYYLPDIEPDPNEISITATPFSDPATGMTAIDYQVTANELSSPIFSPFPAEPSGKPVEHWAGFQRDVRISGNGTSGIARRTTIPETIPSDYAFVVDFSGSMQKTADDNNPSGMTREQVLKEVVISLGKQVFDLHDGSTMGLVPFSTGVPVILDKTNYGSDTSKEIGCSYIGVLKGTYANVDMDFWYNKINGAVYNPGLFDNNGYLKDRTVSQSVMDDIVTQSNSQLRKWYVNIIAQSYGYTGNKAKNWLTKTKGYCRVVDDQGKVIDGAALDNITWKNVDNKNIHCDADPYSDINDPANYDKYKNQLADFLELSNFDTNYGSFLNEKTMDIDATLAGDYLFDENNIKTFIAFQNEVGGTPLGRTCYYAYAETYRILPESPVETFVAHTDHFYEDVQIIKKPSYYPIELTDDISILEDFYNMIPGGDTDSLTGLLRSVSLIAKGENKRKIIFMITDGEDSYPDFRQNLMQHHDLCKVITDGLKNYPSGTTTEDAEIYYISLTDDQTGRDLVQEWQNMCVGQGHGFVASNLEELKAIIGNIMFKNTIDYVDATAK